MQLLVQQNSLAAARPSARCADLCLPSASTRTCRARSNGLSHQHQPSRLHGSASLRQQRRTRARATAEATDAVEHWWERGHLPNMVDIESVQQLVDAMADAGDSLVIVDVFAPWCGACRALYPKLLKVLGEYPDVVFLKINFEENRQMCKQLGVKVLPYFFMYHGAQGRVTEFSCTVSKLQRMRDALDTFYTPICSLEPVTRMMEFPDTEAHPMDATRVAGSRWADSEAEPFQQQQQQQQQPAGVS